MNLSGMIKVAIAADIKISSTIQVMGDFIIYQCALSDGTTASSVSSEPSEEVEQKNILKALRYAGLLLDKKTVTVKQQESELPAGLPKLKGISYEITEIDFRGTVETRIVASGNTYPVKDTLGEAGFEFESKTKSWSRSLVQAAVSQKVAA